MGQTAFTVRMDADIKKRFDELCTGFGMSANTAFNVFARTVVKQERIPFEIDARPPQELKKRDLIQLMDEMRNEYFQNGGEELTLDEINEIIREVRMERRARKDREEKDNKEVE